MYPASLTTPLTRRLAQLSFSTNRLHVSAQRAVFGTLGSAFVSTAAAYVGWTVAYIEGQTAVGVTAFCTMIALRWAVGYWEKARRRWMEDWRRTGDALQRDLEEELEVKVQQQIMIVPDTACKQIEGLLDKRSQELEETKDELQKLLSELDSDLNRS